VSQQELAERLRLEKSTVSRLVAGLEVRGLLVRERDPANRRFVRLSLTPAGQRLHVDLARAMHERQGAVLAAMTPSERAALQTGLVGLLRVLHHSLHDSLHDRPKAHADR
jgi:DNA-binding MarR family transcriptional regulator